MCFETDGCEMCCSHWTQKQKPSVTSSLMLMALLALSQAALFTDIKCFLDQSWLISLNHHHFGVNRLKVTFGLSINPCNQNLTPVLLSAEFGCMSNAAYESWTYTVSLSNWTSVITGLIHIWNIFILILVKVLIILLFLSIYLFFGELDI